MPRFVILTHDHPFLHWDLMLEEGDALRTWRLLKEPGDPGPIPAEPLPDHRLAYLDYEGPVSGNRGEVRQWDRGDYDRIAGNSRRVEVRLRGRRLSGRAVLQPEAAGGPWSFEITRE